MSQNTPPQHLFWQDPKTPSLVVDSLKKGSILVGSSDTVLGLLAPATKEGFEGLNSIKGRTTKPYLVLVGSRQKALKMCRHPVPSTAQKLMQLCWPGPLTLILPAADTVPAYMKSPDGTIALRVPDHAGLLAVLAQVDGLFSTSANLSGQPVPSRIDDLDVAVLERVAYCVVDVPENPTTVPSTLVDCSGPEPRLIRAGAISWDMIQKILVD